MRIIWIIIELIVAFLIWWPFTCVFWIWQLGDTTTPALVNVSTLIMAIIGVVFCEMNTKDRVCPVCSKATKFMSARQYRCPNCRWYFSQWKSFK